MSTQNATINLLYEEVILASGSLVRQEILQKFGYRFVVDPANIDEHFVIDKSPAWNAEQLAIQKAKHVIQRYQNPARVVIAADTIGVDPKGSMLQKPVDENDFRHMMHKRSGRTEQVITGYAIAYNDQLISGAVECDIYFDDIPESVVDDIFEHEAWQDAAGGLRVEGLIKPYIKEYTNDYYAILGLPVGTLSHILRSFPVS